MKSSEKATINCELCGKAKSCKKCYGVSLCSICTSVISTIKNRPDVLRKAWDQFGPGPALSEPIQGTIERASDSPFSKLFSRIAAIHRAKRQDYASNDDPLGNFREARRLGLTPLQGIMVRLTGKYTKACNLVQRYGEYAVKDEGLDDTLLKLANYSLLALLAHQASFRPDKSDSALLCSDKKEPHHHAEDMHQD